LLFLRHRFRHKFRHGVLSSQIKFAKPDQRAPRAIAIRPEVRATKQSDQGIADTIVQLRGPFCSG
jgi:hypothetical protein